MSWDCLIGYLAGIFASKVSTIIFVIENYDNILIVSDRRES